MAKVGTLTLATEIDTKQFDKQIEYIENELEEIEYQLKQADLGFEVGDAEKLQKKYEELSNKLIDLKKKKEDINKVPLDENGGGFKGLSGIIKKITKIGLGLIGLRTGMALLRSSISTVSSQNDEIASKINTIRSAIANALTPVVQVVVNLFARLLAYAGYILNKWFGINIFAKSTANNTKKMKSNLGGANKEATKLKRTLAGFDEMNILQKDGGVSTGGGGGGISPSDVDMSMFDNIEIPGWVKWIADNKEGIIEQLKQIALLVGIAFATAKLIQFMEWINKIKGGVGTLSESLGGMSQLKIFGMIAGIITSIVGIIGLIDDMITGTETFKSVMGDLALVIGGVSAAMIVLNATNPVGWIGLAIGGVMGLISYFSDEEDQLYDTATAQERLNNAQKKFKEGANDLISAYNNMDSAEKKLVEVAKKHNMTRDDAYWKAVKLFDEFQRGKKTYEEFDDTEKELLDTIIKYKGAEQRLGEELEKNQTRSAEIRKEELNKQKSIAYSTKQYEGYRDAMTDAYEHGELGAAEFADAMVTAMYAVDESARQNLAKGVPEEVKRMMIEMSNNIKNNKLPGLNIYATLDTSKAQQQMQKFKAKYPMLFPFAKGGIVQFAKGGILNLPKLAPGGLINKPGPGVAIGGEKGTEGVVPLTDSQQMDRLGMAIGRYVNIRAEIPVSVGNRQVAREIRNINADESFAYNG